ncbi:MAG: hypothetical protein ACD_49C00049G0023 [uncultured bacterium (gcode 4)]|uniref:Uncharacterized protein n=1 Tax=uncultured bacterium (gcode 4) TaxID=1234023 RepID=K2AEB2_9BACT|nr:MAG: hypothetical protein ACD_49C00049G0023 [uncultured bacterium (gcode 4)]
MKNNIKGKDTSKDLGVKDNRNIVWYLCIDINLKETTLEEFEKIITTRYLNDKSNINNWCVYLDLFVEEQPRPWLMYLIGRILEWEIKTVIIKKCSHISNEAYEFLKFVNFLRENNVSLESIKKPNIDLTKCDLRISRNMNIDIKKIEKVIDSL